MAVVDVPVTKGRAKISIDTDKIGQKAYEDIMMAGLKHYVNQKMSKITGASYPDEEERQAEAMKVAEANVEAIYNGDIKSIPGTKTKTKGLAKSAVNTYAMADAREQVKAEIKRQKKKVAHVGAKEITRFAKMLLEHPVKGPAILAKAELRAKEAQEAQAESLAEFGIEIVVDPRKVKQDEEKTARAKAKKAAEVVEEDEPQGLSVPKGTPPAHVVASAQQRPQAPYRR